VLNEAGVEASPAATPDGAVPSRSGHLSPIGVLAVPPWREGLESSALPEASRSQRHVVRWPLALFIAAPPARPLMGKRPRKITPQRRHR